MARYTDPVCRQCRRIGEKLLLKGERCFTPRCAVERRRGPPGGQSSRRRRPSDWSTHLREKQKARFIYGVLERQFRRYFKIARAKPGATGEVLLQVLERRLDNVVFRLSFSESRPQARQLVNHGHFTVNGKRVDIPSYLTKPGDVIGWRKSNGTMPEFVAALTDSIPRRPVPPWLDLEIDTLVGRVRSLPEPSDIDTGIDVRLIVEFYSR